MEYNYEEVKKTNRTVTTVPLYKNLVKVFDKRVIETNGVTKEEMEVFITSEENVKAVKGLESISRNVCMPGLYRDMASVFMLSKTNYDLLLKGKLHVADNGTFEDYDVSKYNEDDYILVMFNWGSHELVDLDGNYIPVAVRVSYDYSNGRMTNKKYDLKKVIEALKGNNNIMVYNEKRYKDGYGEPRELSITSIPYYNASEEEYEQLEFFFVPTKEILNEAMRIKDSYRRVPYMLEKMFGIKPKKEEE